MMMMINLFRFRSARPLIHTKFVANHPFLFLIYDKQVIISIIMTMIIMIYDNNYNDTYYENDGNDSYDNADNDICKENHSFLLIIYDNQFIITIIIRI